MAQAVRAALMRGGTSKGLFLRARDLPAAILPGAMRTQLQKRTREGGGAALDRFLARALGSPDGSGMQLNGIGSGISSTSKVAIVERSEERDGCDVDYFFAQVDMRSGAVDWSGSCGNLAAGVGLFAKMEGLLPEQARTVRIWQANLGYRMDVTLSPEDAPFDTSVPGVPGRGQPIHVQVLTLNPKPKTQTLNPEP